MQNYIYLIVPFFSAISAQIIKFILESIKYKKLNWERLFNGNGGMPSTHTSFTFSLAATVGFLQGITSPLFAICLVFACVVGYDAMGLRMESGKQAIAINKIVDEIFFRNTKIGIQHLKEQLGHKPLEVVMGIVWAILCSFILVKLIFKF
mgnify:CR=1 FL=1